MTAPVAIATSAGTISNGTIPPIISSTESDYPYAHLLPVFDKSEFYPPLTPFEHTDPATQAVALPQSEQRSFLNNATRVSDLTPRFGTEVVGVDLTSLDGPGRDQLALEVARRGILVFRDQPRFLAQTVDQFREWGSYFGRLLIHPTSPHPAGFPEMHITYRIGHMSLGYSQNRITNTLWHSDSSYELQPPGLTTFFLLAQPRTGGDTSYVSTVEALKKLSPPFVAFLKTLKAVHSSVELIENCRAGRRGGVVRRDPVEHVHPVVRKHPVTGEEALFVTGRTTTRILDLKQEESATILNFLCNHIALVADAQVRIKWEPNTVLVWDNRVTSHTPIVEDMDPSERRHGARIAPQAERPIPALDSLVL